MGAAGFPQQGHSARPGSVPATDVWRIAARMAISSAISGSVTVSGIR
jgi:hypothetical protein